MDEQAPPLFTLRLPEAEAVPLIVNIPHTGTFVPEAIRKSLASEAMRALPMTDWYLHHLYDFLPGLGVTTLFANYSRFVVDLNRSPDAASLYPGRFETSLVATRTFWGEEIFREPPDAQTVEQRCRLYHEPYHRKLAQLLQEHVQRFGKVVLIDAHSVASRASLLHGKLTDDIYLGDRDGTSCNAWLTGCVAESFQQAGLKVVKNAPYKGGYTTAHYGLSPAVDALQIEMCQRLYMQENNPRYEPTAAGFVKMRKVLQSVIGSVAGAIADDRSRL